MKKVSSILLKASSMLTALALTIGVSSMNSACMMWFNQPKAPEEMENTSSDNKSLIVLGGHTWITNITITNQGTDIITLVLKLLIAKTEQMN